MVETSQCCHKLKSVLGYTAGQRNLITECNKRSRKSTYRRVGGKMQQKITHHMEKRNNISKRQIQARIITKQHRILNAQTYMPYQFMFSDSAQFFKIHFATVPQSTGRWASSVHCISDPMQLINLVWHIANNSYRI